MEPAHLLEDAVAAFRSRADAGGVALDVRVEPGLPILDVDPIRIGEVLSNLLSNALRATPPGGSVHMAAALVEGARGVALTVEDTGSGIPPDLIPHVFDRFVKAAALLVRHRPHEFTTSTRLSDQVICSQRISRLSCATRGCIDLPAGYAPSRGL